MSKQIDANRRTDANRQTDADDRAVSRRGVLRGAVGGLVFAPGVSHQDWRYSVGNGSGWAGETVLSRDGTDHPPTVTVMTWNLYIGTDLRQLLRRSGDEQIDTAVARLLEDIEQSRFDARAETIADEIASAGPDLIGLQEATLLRMQLPGDYVADPGRINATEYYLDFLVVLQEKLADRGLEYEVASSVTNTDVELPADLDAGSVDIRLTDRSVILARQGLETQNPTRETYEATITIPLPDGVEYLLTRGYCSIDVEVDGTAFTFVNTHLDSVSAATQIDQARELVVDVTAFDRPIVLVGDFNSPADGSETVTYDLLTQFFTDAYAEAVSSEPGYTCCRQSQLQGPRSELTKRLDLVLLRGVGPVTTVERVGTAPDDRVSTVVDDERRRLWPSDHAGVVATLQLESDETTPQVETLRKTGVASDGQTGTRPASSPSVGDPTSDDPASTDVDAPGFGVVAGLVALGAVAVGLLRRRGASESTRFSRPPEK
ncbi:endonuclease/exonuclease/phosphatase family protein [Halogranum amylolyticum]|uniref:endonuclease/exonuclease/phosphatase family protein n=1 Tax=Halogranum amylolyticum TaxID=660520 RepID=UPI000B7D9ED0|nr:endonuclease/exonuclease/phosphatase family protein [Halogranum amylolyticum]